MQQTVPVHHPLFNQIVSSWRIQRRVSVEVLAVGCVTLLCVALRVYHLGAASLWTDEVFSRYYVDLFGLHYIFTTGLSTEATPPTYSLLLKAWMAVWGDSAAAMRSLSTVASALCVPVTYMLGRELVGRATGILAAVLFALSPISLYFAQEARVYALFMLTTSAALWAVAVFLRDPRSIKSNASYVLCGTLCVYLHGTGVLFVVACGAAVWLSLLIKGASERPVLLRWTALNASILVLGLPYLLHEFSASHSGGLDWLPHMSLRVFANCATAVISGIVTPYPWPGFFLALVVLATVIVSLYLLPPSRRSLVVLLGVPCAFVAVVLALSLSRPILLPRILAWTIVPFCVMAAGQLRLPSRARMALLLSLVAAFGIGLFFQVSTLSSNKEPWRDALQRVAPQLERADLVVMSPLFDPMVLQYYAPQLKHPRLWDASLRPTIMTVAAAKLNDASITEPEIIEAIKQKHSVWILSNGLDLERVNRLRSQLPNTDFHEWACGKAPCVVVAGWQPK